MQVDVLTLRYDSTRGVLDDTALREFTRDKVVLAVRDHFYQVGAIPHLTLVIEHRLPAPGPGSRPPPLPTSATRSLQPSARCSISSAPGGRDSLATKPCPPPPS